MRSSLRRAAAGEGAEAHDLQPGEVFGSCRRGRRRGGLQLCQLRAAWGATGQLSGIWLGLLISASGGAAQSASIFISEAPRIDKPSPAAWMDGAGEAQQRPVESARVVVRERWGSARLNIPFHETGNPHGCSKIDVSGPYERFSGAN